MRVDDLMIGSLVGYIKDEDFIKIIITPDLMKECEEYPDRFFPLPVFEDNLMKLGFKCIVVEGYCASYDLDGFIIDMIPFTSMYHQDIRIYHWHQLQKLYYIKTRKKLPIKI